jgi:hypothetical protein
LIVVSAEEEILDIFAICIACSKAVSDGFELSYGTNILLYVILLYISKQD